MALQEGLPDVTLMSAVGKPSVKLFKPVVATKKVLASWLEKEAELPSDLYAVLGTADPEKRCSKLFSAEHCTLLQAQNKDQLRADWLSTAAAKIVRDLANGQSEMMSEQVAKSLFKGGSAP